MNQDIALLRHILEAIACIREFAADGEKAFLLDRKSRSAILYELQTLLESCQKLSPETKATALDLPWGSISGMRNILVHNYMGVDLGLVWQVVQNNLGDIESMARARLAVLVSGES